MTTVAESVDVDLQRPVDLDPHQRLFELAGPVGRDPVEARGHRVPVAAEIGVHEPRLVAESERSHMLPFASDILVAFDSGLEPATLARAFRLSRDGVDAVIAAGQRP